MELDKLFSRRYIYCGNKNKTQKEGNTIYVDSIDPSEIYSNRDTRVFINIGGTLSICFIIQKKRKILNGK